MKPTDRYDTSSLPEAQFEPGSQGRVLRNKLGIKSKRAMDEVETIALKTATDKLLGMYDEDHRFTAEDIRGMHKNWLGDIYEWAGEYRQVNVSKGDFHFAAAKQLSSLMSDLQNGPLQKHTPAILSHRRGSYRHWPKSMLSLSLFIHSAKATAG